MFKQFDVVRLTSGVPDEGIPAGVRAVVLDVRGAEPALYGIEVADSHGRTLYVGVATDDDLEAW